MIIGGASDTNKLPAPVPDPQTQIEQ